MKKKIKQKKQQKRKFYLEISQDFLKDCENRAQSAVICGGACSLADLFILFISGVKLPLKVVKFFKNYIKVKEIKEE